MSEIEMTMPPADDSLLGLRERLRVGAALGGTITLPARELAEMLVKADVALAFGERAVLALEEAEATRARSKRDLDLALVFWRATVVVAVIGAGAFFGALAIVAGWPE